MFLDYLRTLADDVRSEQVGRLSDRWLGVPNTVLRDFEPDDLIPLLGRAEQIVFDNASNMKTDLEVIRDLWKECFRSPLQRAPERRGQKSIPIRLKEAQMELMALFGSVLGATYLTYRMESDQVRAMVGGMFFDEMGRHNRDTLFGQPFRGSASIVFYRKSVRVMLSQYGRLDSAIPIWTETLPSQLRDVDPVYFIDGRVSSLLPIFGEAVERLASEMIVGTLEYGKALRLLERSDYDYGAPEE